MFCKHVLPAEFSTWLVWLSLLLLLVESFSLVVLSLLKYCSPDSAYSPHFSSSGWPVDPFPTRVPSDCHALGLMVCLLLGVPIYSFSSPIFFPSKFLPPRTTQLPFSLKPSTSSFTLVKSNLFLFCSSTVSPVTLSYS